MKLEETLKLKAHAQRTFTGNQVNQSFLISVKSIVLEIWLTKTSAFKIGTFLDSMLQ